MILIDSSVWIDWLRGTVTDAVRFAQQRQGSEERALTHMVYPQVLQGIRLDSQFILTRDLLGAQTLLAPLHATQTYEAAAQLYRSACKLGLTIRKSTDCLIAAIAIEHDALLVHNDRDFLPLAQLAPEQSVHPVQRRR